MSRLSLSDIYRIAVPGDPRLRPDGSTVAYTVTTADRESDENRSEIWLVAAGDAPRRLTGGPRDSSPRWSPDGRSLAFLRPVDGKPQLHLLPMEGGEPRVITAVSLGAGPAVWSPDGRSIAYSAPSGEIDPHAPVVADSLEYKADGTGLLRGLTMHVFVVEVETGETRQVTSGDFHAGEPSWSPDGGRLAFTANMEADRDLVVGGAVYAVDAFGGEPERLTGADVICAGAWWLGERLLVVGHAGDPVSHARMFELGPDGLVEIKTGLDRNIMVGAPGYPGAVPQQAGDDLIFCARDGGCTHVYRAPGEKIVGGDRVVSGVSAAGGRIAYVASTPYSAGDVYLADLDALPGDGSDDTATTRLTDYALHDVELFTPERRTFTAPDGTPVEGFVLRDETLTEPGPLLLDAHGGPHNAWAPVFDGIHLYHQVLAARGWTVLAVNPRASDGYGEAFYTAAVGAWGVADTGDFLSPIDELVEEGIADPDRLAVTGYSYGGYMSCWLSTQTGRFKAAIPGGCVSDLVSMAGTSDAGHFLKAYECRDDITAQSPMTHVAQVTTPTLLLHGETDDRCPVGQAEQWFAALREQGVPVRLVRYPGGSHLFILNGRPSHRVDYNERIVEWLQQWIPVGGTPGSPS
ncbi:S9 family peptidase [Microtetraspora fusca]|uniref:S9 family peptidase n=1 Tax=Microtetraspora fusca TaxID=1997 RepID=UPI00082F5FC2|nr:S9 family peptidase [Microtetraspora fusca]